MIKQKHTCMVCDSEDMVDGGIPTHCKSCWKTIIATFGKGIEVDTEKKLKRFDERWKNES